MMRFESPLKPQRYLCLRRIKHSDYDPDVVALPPGGVISLVNHGPLPLRFWIECQGRTAPENDFNATEVIEKRTIGVIKNPSTSECTLYWAIGLTDELNDPQDTWDAVEVHASECNGHPLLRAKVFFTVQLAGDTFAIEESQ